MPASTVKARERARAIVEGAVEGDLMGTAVASAGDVNGDGHADVVVGAPGAAPSGRLRAGSAHVLLGPLPSRLRVDDPMLGYRIDGAAPYDLVGEAVGGAGDVNGDGLDDVVVSARRVDQGETTPAAYVVFGKRDLDGMDLGALGAGGIQVEGLGAPGGPVAVAGAGDVDGDGLSEVVLGAPSASPSGRDGAGAVFVLKGRRAARVLDARQPAGAGTIVLGPEAGAGLGTAVAGVGDVNGDRRPDIAAGAPGTGSRVGTSSTARGTVAILFAPLEAATVDLARPSWRGLRLIAGPEPDAFVTVPGAGTALAAGGDANGDGLADVILGVPGEASPRAYAVYGRRPAGSLVLERLGTRGLTLLPSSDFSGDELLFGNSVAGGFDLDGDGRSDVAVAAESFDPGGVVHMARGRARGGSVRLDDEALSIVGPGAQDRFGHSIAMSGDVTGDRRPDLLIGAPGTHRAGVADAGAVYVLSG